MSLTVQVLGLPGRDNAVLVTVDSGQAVTRLLFDCGDGCLWQLPFGLIQEIDHVLFSHYHMDHVGGFDTFFRCTFNHTAKPNHIWGPPGTADVMQHRFRGFGWNLVGDQTVSWNTHDLYTDRVVSNRFELADLFAHAHPAGDRTVTREFLTGPGFTVEAHLMDHGVPSVAYVVRETPRVNINVQRMAELGLRPGPWLQRIRGPIADRDETLTVLGESRSVRELQDSLVVETPGESAAYLTDFRLDGSAMDRLTETLRGVGTVVCESQYRESDADLAARNFHMTSTQAARLAHRAGVGKLVLFHLSDRYRASEWQEILAESREVFPATEFPPHWETSA
jgi:ribonuclease Z